MIRRCVYLLIWFGVALAAAASAYAIFMRGGDHQFERTDIAGLFIRHHAIDVGVVSDGGSFETQVEFLNRSSAPLQIESAKADCGCTTVKQNVRTIAPGAAAALPVTVDTEQLGAGKFLKHVLVAICDSRGGRGTVVFQVGGRIVRGARFAFITPHLDFPYTRPDEAPLERTAYLAGPEGVLAAVPADIYLSDLADRLIEVPAGAPGGNQSTKAVRIHFRVNPVSTDREFNFQICMTQKGIKAAKACLPVRGRIVTGIVVDPAQLYMPVPIGGPGRETSLRVRLPAGAHFDDDGVASDGPIQWHVSRDPVDAAALVINVRLRDGAATSARGIYLLKISADHQKLTKAIPVHIVPLPVASGVRVEATQSGGSW